MKKVKVMHISYSLDIGGAEAVILGILNKLDRDRFEPSICTFQPGGQMEGQFRDAGIPIHVVPKREGKDLSLPLNLWRLFRKEKIDVIHPHNAYMWLYGTFPAKLAGVKGVVLTEHANLRNPSSLYYRACRAAQLFTDRITVNSQQVEDVLVEEGGLNRGKFELIRNGIDLSQYQRADKSGEMRSQLGLAMDDVVVAMVARLAPPKDHMTLFKSIESLVGDYPNIRLLVVGGGEDEPRLHEYVENNNLTKNIIFLGFRDDIKEILEACDIFVLSSLKEGQSISIMEAMAMSIPVIATNTGGTPELIEDERSGLLVPEKDADAISKHLKMLINDEQHRAGIGQGGLERIKEQYDLDKIVKRYETIYQSICG